MMLHPMIPIAALSETQSWQDASLRIGVECKGERLHVRLTIEGHYGDELPPEDWQQAAFERAIVGLDCVVVDWPTWSMSPDAWPTVAARMGATLSRRSLRYDRSDPALASRLAAELRGVWSADAQWQPNPSRHLRFSIGHTGYLTFSPCEDAEIASLRGHTGLAIGEQTSQKQWTMTVDPADALAVLDRVASWWPEALEWVRAEISCGLQ